jgi:hypothetical protein
MSQIVDSSGFGGSIVISDFDLDLDGLPGVKTEERPKPKRNLDKQRRRTKRRLGKKIPKARATPSAKEAKRAAARRKRQAQAKPHGNTASTRRVAFAIR